MAAVLACRPSVAGHGSAAWLWGLSRSRPGTIHLVAPTRRRPRAEFVVHCAELAAVDMTAIDGVPATALPRTLLDLAVVLSSARFERTLERADELGILDLRMMDEVLGRNSGHPGAGSLRRAFALYRPEPAFTRSTLERQFLKLVRKKGLPIPAMNFNVRGYELDAYWEREQFAVELDVYETHGTHAAFERDRLREDDLLLIGVEMIRVTGPRLRREPDAVIHRVAAHLTRRRRELPYEAPT